MWGLTLSVKPTKNLELGFAHTVIFAGYGRPFTFGTFFHTFSVLGNGQDVDPGKRVTEFNFAYHLPWLRNVVLYDEAMAYDDPIEGKFVARYAMAPGVYIPKIPGLNKLDLRAEAVYTNNPKLALQAYYYSNAHYPQGYTNYGQILGSWVGRQGTGGQATSTYWLTGRSKATVSYRKMVADKSFLQGGNMNDVSAGLTWLLRPDIELSASGQYDRWNFPLLGAGAKSTSPLLSVSRYIQRREWERSNLRTVIAHSELRGHRSSSASQRSHSSSPARLVYWRQAKARSARSTAAESTPAQSLHPARSSPP